MPIIASDLACPRKTKTTSMRTTLLSLAIVAAPIASQPMLGSDAPEVDFKGALNLDDASNLADLAGRVIMLEFFATW